MSLCVWDQVATQRTKPYIKVEFPHINDSIERVKEVGMETKKKLGDLAAAAQKAGIYDLNVPKNSVSKGTACTLWMCIHQVSGVRYENVPDFVSSSAGPF